MAILKSEIRNKFSTIPNSIIRAKDISDGDYRLLIYLYSLPNGWKINQNFLGTEFNCNRRNISAKIKRIKESGYLEITKETRNKETDYIYVLKEKDVSVSDVSVNDASVNDASLSDTYINTNNINTNKIKNENIYIKPTLEELIEYCKLKDLNVDCQCFYDYYESNGWKVGRNKMKDWKATLRNWHRRNEEKKKPKETYIQKRMREIREKEENESRRINENIK